MSTEYVATPDEVEAAKLRILVDKRLGRESDEVILQIAETGTYQVDESQLEGTARRKLHSVDGPQRHSAGKLKADGEADESQLQLAIDRTFRYLASEESARRVSAEQPKAGFFSWLREKGLRRVVEKLFDWPWVAIRRLFGF